MPTKGLQLAKINKDNEYYTLLTSIEKFFSNQKIREHLNGKIIFMPCDDIDLIPEKAGFKNAWERSSQFWYYFHNQFKKLGLKAIVATSYRQGADFVDAQIYEGEGNDHNIFEREAKMLMCDGDFKSQPVQDLLEYWKTQGEVVIITNPPFSEARNFIEWINKNEVDYCIIGAVIWMTNSYFKPLAMSGSVIIGDHIPEFMRPDGSIKKISCQWYHNIPTKKDPLYNTFRYRPNNYSFMDAGTGDKAHMQEAGVTPENTIKVKKINEIPENYSGVMHVPGSINKYDYADKFEMLGYSGHSLVSGKSVGNGYFIQMKQAEIDRLEALGIEVFGKDKRI